MPSVPRWTLPAHRALRWRLLSSSLVAVLALGACGRNINLSAPSNAQDGGTAKPDDACSQSTDTGNVVVGSGDPGDPAAPEPASGYRVGKTATYAKKYMVVTANPLASKAGCEVLKKGGTAVDAAVAVQMVLGLVEPQSSGIGGGAFMLHYDAKTRAVKAYDGRETAPAAATPDYLRYVSATDQTPPVPDARASGRSIGTPGVVRMLDMAYKAHGKLPWAELFEPAISLANNGFRISGRMAAAIAISRPNLLRDDEAKAYFLNEDGSAKDVGTLIKNPAYAATLGAIASGGADAFYTGPIARGIVDEIKTTSGGNPAEPITPGLTELSDLANYQPKQRDVVCGTYRSFWICSMPPPSAGGITVVATMGILENFALAPHVPGALDIEGGKPSVMGVHLISEAERLAYADRDKYLADTDFVPLPRGSWDTLLNKPYLRGRANLIQLDRSMGTAVAGDFGGVPRGVVQTSEHGTTHASIVDREGNVVVMTMTVESGLGSFHMTQGFMLNNELTDFSATPTDAEGLLVANRVEAGKRPRSSMAPTLVFQMAPDGSRGEFLMGTGAPGGGTIIQYVVKTLVGVLDWNLDAQQSASLVDFGANNAPTTNVGGEHPNISGDNDPLVQGLRGLGHKVSTSAQSSGIATILRVKRNGEQVWQGGVDPRREGIVLGDTFKP